jgi:hypothetical protein
MKPFAGMMVQVEGSLGPRGAAGATGAAALQEFHVNEARSAYGICQ